AGLGGLGRPPRGRVPVGGAGLGGVGGRGPARGRPPVGRRGGPGAPSGRVRHPCVAAPQAEDGSADLSYIEAAAREIGPHLPSEAVVVNKSTVPVGSTRVVERVLGRDDVTVVSNPELLREGSAVHDFLNPDRIVIGSDDQS